MTANETDTPLTISVPEAGKRYFNLGRNSAYAAAERGDLPTVRIGRLLRVPVRALEQMLDKASQPKPANPPTIKPGARQKKIPGHVQARPGKRKTDVYRCNGSRCGPQAK